MVVARARSVVDEIFGIDAEFIVKQVFVERGDTHQVVDAVLFEPGCHTGADTPDIGDGRCGQISLRKVSLSSMPMRWYVLCGNIERYLSLE